MQEREVLVFIAIGTIPYHSFNVVHPLDFLRSPSQSFIFNVLRFERLIYYSNRDINVYNVHIDARYLSETRSH